MTEIAGSYLGRCSICRRVVACSPQGAALVHTRPDLLALF